MAPQYVPVFRQYSPATVKEMTARGLTYPTPDPQ